MSKKWWKEDNETIPAILFQELQPNGFSEITDPNELTQLRIRLNNDYKRWGIDYFTDFKISYFGNKLKSGELDESNINYIYDRLESVIFRLVNGDIEQALWKLNNGILPITTTDEINGYDTLVHNQIVLDLTNYLS